MRLLLALLTFAVSSFAMEYYAKLEPVNSYIVKAAVSGKVLYTNDDIEGKEAKSALIVKIDSKLNEIELKQSQNKLKSLDSMISIESTNFNRLNKISSRSAFEKDNQKVKVLNLETQKADLLIKIATLKDMINNKRLVEKNSYIYDIAVKKGDYVNPGTVLYEAKDLSHAKAQIFVPIDEASKLKDKKIFLDGKESSLKINKVYEVADAKHISSYKVEIIIPEVQNFSRLVKIEFK